MTRELDPKGPDFNVLKDYLSKELGKMAADERAVRLATSRSFTEWAKTVVGRLAESLGVSLGFLVGQILGTYETVKEGFSEGWRKGFDRGRGRASA